MRSWFASRPQTSEQASSFGRGKPPPGISSTPLLGQTLSFHDAAHDDVRAVLAGSSDTGQAAHLKTVRLNVIGRNVALATSYETALQVLDQTWSDSQETKTAVSRALAYDQLMSAFFSPPNLLLEDENDPEAKSHRGLWDEILDNAAKEPRVAASTDSALLDWMKDLDNGSSVDLYEVCKTLGHHFALGNFLGLSAASEQAAAYSQAKSWGDEMLRGQFSLPVGVNVGFFKNAFSKGQAAKKQYDALVAAQLEETSKCPFSARLEQAKAHLSKESAISHMSMFSSSLVVKAFASLATAMLLQLYSTRNEQSSGTLARELRLKGAEEADELLESIITETERVSPPIIGVMRRVTDPRGLTPTAPSDAGITIPYGWDVWPYLPLANRDPNVYDCPDEFQADRFKKRAGAVAPRSPLTFGAGVKACAGHLVVRSWLKELAKTLIYGRQDTSQHQSAMDMSFDEDDVDPGVRQWLGWDESTDNVSWKGVKQLPTQRPRRGIRVAFYTYTSA